MGTYRAHLQCRQQNDCLCSVLLEGICRVCQGGYASKCNKPSSSFKELVPLSILISHYFLLLVRHQAMRSLHYSSTMTLAACGHHSQQMIVNIPCLLCHPAKYDRQVQWGHIPDRASLFLFLHCILPSFFSMILEWLSHCHDVAAEPAPQGI